MNILTRAEDLLTSRCMQARGWRYDLESSRAPDTAAAQFTYVIDDPTWAARAGFGSQNPQRASQSRSESANNSYLQSLPPLRQIAYRQDLFGDGKSTVTAPIPGGGQLRTNTTGCLAAARISLYGDIGSWFRGEVVVTNLPGLYRQHVREDERYVAAVSRWADCMRTSGYPYQTPTEVRAGGFAAMPFEDEVRLAVAEASCAQETRLGQIARQIDAEYEQSASPPYQPIINHYNTLRYAALDKAQHLLAIPPTSK